MTEYAIDSDFRLGRLLVDLELVTKRKVEQAAVLSSLTTLPLGKLLSLLGYVPERMVRSTIEAQSLLRDRLIKLDLAKKAMYMVRATGVSFSDALVSLGFDNATTKRTRLGELLTDAKKIDQDKLEFGLKISNSSGLPLGQIFILMNQITEDFLRITLALQRELRAGNIERPKVIARLTKASQADETAASLPSAACERIKLGELLIAAGLSNEEDLKKAAEVSSSLNMLMGEFLVQKHVIDRDVLGLSLKLQSLAWQNKISLAEAAQILKDASTYLNTEDFKLTSESELAEIEEYEVTLYNFLRLSGYLTEDKLADAIKNLVEKPRLNASVMKHTGINFNTDEGISREAIKLALKDPRALRIILNEMNPQDRSIVDAALVFHKLVQDKKMSLKEALFNFSIKRSDVSNVLSEFGN